MTTNRELETLYNMITINAAQAMNVNDHSLKAGNPADLVVLSAPNVLEALREHAAPLHVISRGKPIDSDKMKTVAVTGEW
jgi:cytosine deaminase